MTKDEREILHDIIIDIRKALHTDNDEIRAGIAQQVDRLYELYRNSI